MTLAQSNNLQKNLRQLLIVVGVAFTLCAESYPQSCSVAGLDVCSMHCFLFCSVSFSLSVKSSVLNFDVRGGKLCKKGGCVLIIFTQKND